MYNNLYGYNPQPNPYENRLNYLQQMQAQSQRMDITTVNGRKGAEMFSMPPNSRVLLLDENDPIVWMVQSDGAGYKTINAYDIVPHQPQEENNIKSLEQRIARLEEILNAKSDSNSVKQTGTTAEHNQSVSDASTI